MKNLYCLIVFVFCLVSVPKIMAATLAWDANCDSRVAGYKVYYGTNGVTSTNVVPAYIDDCGVSQPQQTQIHHLPYTFSETTVGRTNTSLTITNLLPTFTYSFVVTAYDDQGLESDYSNEVTYTVPTTTTPPQPPAALKFP
jgi:hypothetical protein